MYRIYLASTLLDLTGCVGVMQLISSVMAQGLKERGLEAENQIVDVRNARKCLSTVLLSLMRP
jgi:hypothetical protein